ncbi:MAG: porin family protein [Proteiniphilum sp.]|uniref:porin family protein n=1 Tax=Proteiniphilum sp. TaxID=1926877 RepID=UPI0009278AC5|nr:porin family protein [Proteiniphilum sp.]MEA5128100.1 porin family protein [Proteiniphilum sp.]OJV85915.1 MAG: hypothetical protein BGO34_03150 [Bacteroidia bacterium 44-10]
MRHFFSPVVLCLLLSLGISPLYAQREIFKGELYLGVGGGSLFSKVDFVPSVPMGFKQGIYGGISAKYISEKHLGIVMEINYSQRGWEEEFESSSDFSYSRTLNYVDIPFMTHIYAGRKTRFIINIGPQISFLVGDNQKMSQALSDDLDERRAEDPEARIGMQYEGMYELKRVDYGLIGGIGMEFKTGIGDFDLEGRYYFGLGDIFTSRRSENAYFSRSASRVIGVKLTYYMRMF